MLWDSFIRQLVLILTSSLNPQKWSKLVQNHNFGNEATLKVGRAIYYQKYQRKERFELDTKMMVVSTALEEKYKNHWTCENF